MKVVEVRDEYGTLVGHRVVALNHVYDPSYTIHHGEPEPERCVCGREQSHRFHRHTMKRAA